MRFRNALPYVCTLYNSIFKKRGFFYFYFLKKGRRARDKLVKCVATASIFLHDASLCHCAAATAIGTTLSVLQVEAVPSRQKWTAGWARHPLCTCARVPFDPRRLRILAVKMQDGAAQTWSDGGLPWAAHVRRVVCRTALTGCVGDTELEQALCPSLCARHSTGSAAVCLADGATCGLHANLTIFAAAGIGIGIFFILPRPNPPVCGRRDNVVPATLQDGWSLCSCKW